MTVPRQYLVAAITIAQLLAPCSVWAGSVISTATATATILDPPHQTLVLGSVANLTSGETLVALQRTGESLSVFVQAAGPEAHASKPASLELVGPPGAAYAISQSLSVFGEGARRERSIPLKAQHSSRILSPSGVDTVALGGAIPWERQTSPSSAVLEITINYN